MDDRWPANGIAAGHIDSLGKVLYDIWSIILGCRCSHENGSQKPKIEKDVKKSQVEQIITLIIVIVHSCELWLRLSKNLKEDSMQPKINSLPQSNHTNLYKIKKNHVK